MKRHRYHCGNCDEVFYSDRANINERHLCGEIGILDWEFDGTNEPRPEEHGH